MTALSDVDGMSIRGRAILVVGGHTSVSNFTSVNFLASATGVTSGNILVTVTQTNGGLFAGNRVYVSAH